MGGGVRGIHVEMGCGEEEVWDMEQLDRGWGGAENGTEQGVRLGCK